MLKRAALAVVAVFVAWYVLDFIGHGVILAKTYTATAELWRPMAEMKMGLMAVVTLVSAAVFVSVYARLVHPKCVLAGFQFGLLFGLGIGFSMGYGTYAVMPIPYKLALAWFLICLVEATVGGLIVGLIVRPPAARA